MGGRGANSGMSPSGINRQQARDFVDYSTEGQIKYAKKWGYQDPLVDLMVKEAGAEGYKEGRPRVSGHPSYDHDGNITQLPSNAYRCMNISGSGRLKDRQAEVYVTEQGPVLMVSDGRFADTYEFSDNRYGLGRAIKSGKKFIETRNASGAGGPDPSKFMVRG